MEMKKTLVFFGLLSVFVCSFGAELSPGLKPLSPQSMKLLMKDAGVGAVAEDSQTELEKRSAESKESSKNGPLNVILLLVDRLNESNAAAYLKNQVEFPVHGTLKPCLDNTHPLPESCDCTEQLGWSVVSLRSWAQRVKGMSTSTFHEMPTSVIGPQARLIDRQRRTEDVLYNGPIDQSGEANMGTKLKEVFLNKFDNGMTVTQPFKSSRVYMSSVAELTSNIFKELSLNPNKNGNLAIVRTSVDGLNNFLELFKRYVSPSNTMTVVMSSCPHYSDKVPFFAGGLGSDMLPRVVDLKNVADLSAAIRAVIDEKNQQGIVDADKPAVIFMSEKQLIPPVIRVFRDISDEGGMKIKRDDAAAAKPQPKSDEGNGQEAMTQSTMMIVTVVTATITYALKF